MYTSAISESSKPKPRKNRVRIGVGWVAVQSTGPEMIPGIGWMRYEKGLANKSVHWPPASSPEHILDRCWLHPCGVERSIVERDRFITPRCSL
jgi:hypothetical protein